MPPHGFREHPRRRDAPSLIEGVDIALGGNHSGLDDRLCQHLPHATARYADLDDLHVAVGDAEEGDPPRYAAVDDRLAYRVGALALVADLGTAPGSAYRQPRP